MSQLPREVLRHVPRSIFGEVDALSFEQVLRLPFDHTELLAKLDLTPVEIQEDIHVKSVADLLGLAEELLVAVVGPSILLELPFVEIDVSLEKIFVTELLDALLDL